jgi:hypothetical protein
MHALALSSDVLNSFSLVKVLCADTENRTLARIDTTNHGVSASSKRAVRLLSSEFLGSSKSICVSKGTLFDQWWMIRPNSGVRMSIAFSGHISWQQ